MKPESMRHGELSLAGSRGWEVTIGEHPTTQTVVFEGFNGHTWEPIKGQRIYGPGPRMGSIVTNAVAGGPAQFRGSPVGYKSIRVRCARYDGHPIPVMITSDDRQFSFVLADELAITFIIEEEKSLEELLSEP